MAHAMVDSSPQGGHDYELLSLCAVPKTKLASLHVDIIRLEQARSMTLEERIAWQDDERAIFLRIAGSLWDLVPPPTLLGMGKGRSTLGHKFHASMHAIYLIAGPGKRFEEFVKSIQTWVSDFGTESGFSNVRTLPLSSLFCFFQEDAGQACVDEDEEVDFAALPDANRRSRGDVPHADTNASVTIGGVLHILHNCFQGLSGSLEHFSAVVDQLRQVAKLVGRPESKERSLSTCFNDDLGRALSPEIRRFASLVYDKRWGTVSRSVVEMLRLQASLPRKWSLQSFLAGAAARPDEHDLLAAQETPDTVSLGTVDEAILSPFFWQYLRMIEKFAILQNTLTCWAESCSCHWELHDGENVPEKLKSLWRSCPMRGRRCVDLASGSFWEYVHRPGRAASVSLSV